MRVLLPHSPTPPVLLLKLGSGGAQHGILYHAVASQLEGEQPQYGFQQDQDHHKPHHEQPDTQSLEGSDNERHRDEVTTYDRWFGLSREHFLAKTANLDPIFRLSAINITRFIKSQEDSLWHEEKATTDTKYDAQSECVQDVQIMVVDDDTSKESLDSLSPS